LRILRAGGALGFQDAAFVNLPAANQADLRLSQGLPAFGASSEMRALNQVDFTKVAGDLTRVQNLFTLGDVETALKLSAGGQFTEDVLPPSEKYYLGGFYFGRGFFNGEITGDRALGATVELQFNTGFAHTPILPDRRLNVQFYSFFDYGKTWDLGPFAVDQHISSIGIGARSDVTPWMFVELEGVHRLTTQLEGTGSAVGTLGQYAFYSRVVFHY
jgi:hemolysin activation/secretion protein